LFHRKRPIDFHPTAPRAKKLVETDKLGSLPSNLVVLATTFSFAVFTINSWVKNFAPLNSVESWQAGLIAMAFYLMTSFTKVHLGLNYPSDCIFTAVPILVIIGSWYFLMWLESATSLCPSCTDPETGKETFCYADSAEI